MSLILLLVILVAAGIGYTMRSPKEEIQVAILADEIDDEESSD